MTVTIRIATDADLPATVEVMNAAFPDHAETVESTRHFVSLVRDSDLNPHLTQWVAERGGRVLGAAQVWQAPWMFHPERYQVDLAVLPDAARGGIGTHLAQTVEAHLRGLGAREVLAGTYETRHHARRMLEARGFTEAMRFFDNVLTLDTFDPADWAAQMEVPEGVRAVTLAALMEAVGQDAAMRAMHAAFCEVRLDVPRTGEATLVPLDEFSKRCLTDPTFAPDLVMLAVTDAGEVAALSELWTSDTDEGRLNIGLTGTRRAWRRKGLALALKLRGMVLARERGIREIWTGNASTNAPMLALNERLGFRPRPAYIEYKWGGV